MRATDKPFRLACLLDGSRMSREVTSGSARGRRCNSVDLLTRRVLLLVPQTSQNEIVYSAWVEKLTKKLMSHIAINSMRLPAVAGL